MDRVTDGQTERRPENTMPPPSIVGRGVKTDKKNNRALKVLH